MNTNVSNIIDLSKHMKDARSYHDKLKELKDTLSDMSDTCFSAAINLALAGKWKAWDKSMPVGASFPFSEDMLIETGDELVTKTTQLHIDMLDMIEKIQTYLNSNK